MADYALVLFSIFSFLAPLFSGCAPDLCISNTIGFTQSSPQIEHISNDKRVTSKKYLNQWILSGVEVSALPQTMQQLKT
jgi:hypothetical protein